MAIAEGPPRVQCGTSVPVTANLAIYCLPPKTPCPGRIETESGCCSIQMKVDRYQRKPVPLQMKPAHLHRLTALCQALFAYAQLPLASVPPCLESDPLAWVPSQGSPAYWYKLH